MILKASQRAGGGRQLASHLLNDRDNEHVTVAEMRGFAADTLHGAFQEAHAISRATRCKQYLFSLSLSPPKGVLTAEIDFARAADEAERRLGLDGQPRAIVIHEKEGRRHAHVVWSRINADTIRAINLPHFKNKLTALSKELYLKHDWPLPEGLRTNGGKSPLNFTLDEWQQAKRLGRDPREIKDAIRDCWARSDNARALAHALEERGYMLARGDRRGFVVIDTDGEVFSLARYAGLKTKEVRDKLGDPDALPSVAETKARLQRETTRQLSTFVGDLRKRHGHELFEGRKALTVLVSGQRVERAALGRVQAERHDHETRLRASRFRRGLAGIWDTFTGRKRSLRHQNEREATDCARRDDHERETLMASQFEKRRPFQADLDRTRKRHTDERRLLARQVAEHRQRLRRAQASQDHRDSDLPHQRTRRRGSPSLDL